MASPWKLFLDDDADHIRNPARTVENPEWRAAMGLAAQRPKGHDVAESWVLARSCAEAVATVRLLGFPSFVSFDHDLGDGPSGKKFADFLIELDLDEHSMPADFSWETHSGNPVGRANINGLLEGYMREREGTNKPNR